MAIVGLIPAAGYATRLAGSVTGSKEVQVVRGRPVMAYLVDRLRLGGEDIFLPKHSSIRALQTKDVPPKHAQVATRRSRHGIAAVAVT